MSVVLPQAFQRGAIRAAGLLLAVALSNSAGIQAGTAQEASAPVHKMSELKIAATIRIGKIADWVAVTSNGVWVGSKEPNSVKQVAVSYTHLDVYKRQGMTRRATSPFRSNRRNAWVKAFWVIPSRRRLISLNRSGVLHSTARMSMVHFPEI